MIPINNFNFVGEIGEGGMGKVYRYAHVRLNRDVAIKFLQPELSSREDLVERFKSEAIAQAKMSHSNIATVYEFDQINDMFYMVLEYVKGETLDSVIRKEGRLSWQIAVQYAIGILDGLDHAHSFNIVHRDIKPSNLMITEQQTVKILDFGIARILNTARLTKTRHAIGTLEYMSPEQIKAHETDARSDIYAVGIVLYEMLTGQIPFVKDTEFELQQAQINEKPKSPCTFSEEIPKEIARLVLKALEKNPEKRFSSAREFSEALRKQIAFAPSPASANTEWLKPIKQFCLDYPGIIFLAALLTSAIAIFNVDKTVVPSISQPPVTSVATFKTVVPVEQPKPSLPIVQPDQTSKPQNEISVVTPPPKKTQPESSEISKPLPVETQPILKPESTTIKVPLKPDPSTKQPTRSPPKPVPDHGSKKSPSNIKKRTKSITEQFNTFTNNFTKE